MTPRLCNLFLSSLFRRLGFAIWCPERMGCSGLMASLYIPDEKRFKWNCFHLTSVVNAWRSILGEAELAEARRKGLDRTSRSQH